MRENLLNLKPGLIRYVAKSIVKQYRQSAFDSVNKSVKITENDESMFGFYVNTKNDDIGDEKKVNQ